MDATKKETDMENHKAALAIDPRINCAAEICCGPPPDQRTAAELNQEAHRLRVSILVDLGVPEEMAHRVSKSMVTHALCFMPQQLADVIREIAFPAAATATKSGT